MLVGHNESEDEGNPVNFKLEKSPELQSRREQAEKTLPKRIPNTTGRFSGSSGIDYVIEYILIKKQKVKTSFFIQRKMHPLRNGCCVLL
jgi:hypothetical protein